MARHCMLASQMLLVLLPPIPTKSRIRGRIISIHVLFARGRQRQCPNLRETHPQLVALQFIITIMPKLSQGCQSGIRHAKKEIAGHRGSTISPAAFCAGASTLFKSCFALTRTRTIVALKISGHVIIVYQSKPSKMRKIV